MNKRRSQAWFGPLDKDGFIHRSWMKNRGATDDMFDGRPVIGICNTFSELTPCNAHFRELVQEVKNGVLEAGGYPLEFPVFSCGESNLRPTAMLFRNLASMDVEESIRGNPIDGVVLMAGCDKTTPALLMGAASANLPTILVSGGPMLNGRFRGETLGSGTDVWKFSEDVRGGKIDVKTFMDAESAMSRSAGHCNTVGTASTMAVMAESLGVTLPYNATYPAVDANRARIARLSGRRIVDMVAEDLCLNQVLVRDAFLNAIRVNGAIGGSTNAVVHLLAIAGRAEVPLTLQDWDDCGRDIPTLVDCLPSGRFLMEDFCYAGGVPAVMKRIEASMNLDVMTVTGDSLKHNIESAQCYNDEVIRPLSQPLVDHGGIAILKGNLAPKGAVLKPSAATPELMNHRGKAVTFSTIEDFKARIDSPDLDIDKDSILVLKGAGPKGYPGMAEVGNLPLPKKLLEQGVRDMVRISDARMSGTAFGTVVLHVAPESAAGGVIGLVEDGDMIELNVEQRKLHLEVSDEELQQRRNRYEAEPSSITSGYQKLYIDHVLQADLGADLDFLVGCRGADVPRESH
ncbi:dihydroxy-acid dehydratase [Vibrio nigripulchritudo]|uniref:IlvD/Edd family dehydratase n=1 Tax=Vibrio nigripulchritudo TaxID=28173 RepID=UPI00190DFB6D|nr:IlvD/Edd family dehydratase [Vibrio nigripulchritudo]BCL70146.1 dihydroxy-acid dehydratase [Vibrio nigripulchritudo]BDU31496.1 dihydroxy-acid dehydratase [Vibrio nigripulchritudo]